MIRRPPRTTRTATLLPYTTLFRSRWPEGFRCPRCAGTVHCVLRDGTRKVFQCSACRHQASLIAGTLLQGTKLPLTTWFLAIYLISQATTGQIGRASCRERVCQYV